MKNRGELERENKALRDRISKLSAASQRISASLDVNIVLREVVAGARTLTGARHGIIPTTGNSGQPQDYVLSCSTPADSPLHPGRSRGRRILAAPHPATRARCPASSRRRDPG